MGEEVENKPRKKPKDDENGLPFAWSQVQTAIWLIGLAILFWKGWWFPGILVLVAISGLYQAAVTVYLGRRRQQLEQAATEERLIQERGKWLPAVCPTCGGPLSVDGVRWTGPQTAVCPYCSANLKP